MAAQDPTAVTALHQLALPHFLSFSPVLAATHVLRTRHLHNTAAGHASGSDARADPALFPGHCVRCGHFLHDGSSPVRVRRKPSGHTKLRSGRGTARSAGRSVQTQCGVCSYLTEHELEDTARPYFPKARDRRKRPKVQSEATVALSIASCSPLGAVDTATDRTTAASPAPGPPAKVAMSPARLPVPVRKPRPAVPDEREPLRVTSAVTATVPHSKAPSKVRSKKKSGLQDLLARNREKQAQEQRKEQPGGGLAAFLSGL